MESIIKKYNIDSITDLGCGDCTWMPSTTAFQRKYSGIDVVKNVINDNISKYGNKFMHGDIITMNLLASDLFIIRDVIFHLDLKTIQKLFDNIKDKFKYLLITSSNNFANNDIFDGGRFRPTNILIEPFNKIDYIDRIYEQEFDRHVLLFDYKFNH